MPKHIDFRKREKDEKTFTFSCNVRNFGGTLSSTNKAILSLRRHFL
jgi:hypothetical protein